MLDNTLTLELEGDVPLARFAEALIHFHRLLNELEREVAEDTTIEWLIDDLQAGSARATAAGFSQNDESVQKVIHAYERVGDSLQRRESIPYSSGVAREARYITEIISDKITAVRFETARTESIIYGVFDVEKQTTTKPRVSLGAVKGKVQAISSRGKLKFTLYDSIFDKSISCYLRNGQEEIMRDIWGKLVTVTGRVTRDGETGQAKAVREITTIDPIPEVKPGSYKVARGALPWEEGDEPAEVSLRRLRLEPYVAAPQLPLQYHDDESR